MASSADVRDMLDLPGRSPAGRPPPAKRMKTEGKKMEGISRELQNLIGDDGSAAVTVMQNQFKQKPKWNKKVSPWIWSKFTNEARTDGLELSHWVRGSPAAGEYLFAKYNKPVDVMSYTEEEYDKCLADAAWTPRETAYLFELCREYDLRWLVINDRYDYFPEEDEPRSLRTLEDLKERYYFCCRTLLELRRDNRTMTWTARDIERYNAMDFNKEKEVIRKQHLERLLSRSPAEIAEEEKLILEYRKLQESSKKLVQERQDLLRLLESPQTSASFAQFQSSQGLSQLATNILAADKNRRRKNVSETGPAGATVSTTPVSAAGPNTNGQHQGQQLHQSKTNQANAQMSPSAQAAAHDSKGQHAQHRNSHQPAASSSSGRQAETKAEMIQSAIAKRVAKRVSQGEERLYGISFHEKLSPGVFLRSTRVNTLKPTVHAKVSTVLAELSISSKLAMPTAKVVERYEELQKTIQVLLEAKKQADKLEAELRVLKGQS
ncbi:uncharacterized protein V1516DRAFT_679861, partial [Lipomyces oligophaga]|uniref:uncharacterized protein n=1 Tax=Lipomyces oligophaga TaxID=45792 RepID=UPI0034CF80F4